MLLQDSKWLNPICSAVFSAFVTKLEKLGEKVHLFTMWTVWKSKER